MAEATLTDVTSKLSEANVGLGGISSALAGMGSSLGKIISTLEGFSGKISSMMSSPVPIAIDVDVAPGAPAPDATDSGAIAVPMTGMQETLSKIASTMDSISGKLDSLKSPAFVDSWFPKFHNGLMLIHNDLVDAFSLDKEKMRLAAEQMAEAGRIGEGAETKKVEDKSFDFDFGFGTVAVAILGLLVGFFQGFFGPVGTLMKSWGTAIKNFFGKPLKWGWTTFKAMLADSKVAGWYKSVKSWFQSDLKFK